MAPLYQSPAPGSHHLCFRGDTVTFSLSLSHEESGAAWLRTNLGQGAVARKEIRQEVLQDQPRLGRDWFDIPMPARGPRRFALTLPLCELGHFEAKAYFLKQGETVPLWPEGKNVAINVVPADACCANLLYNAFVRQFGPNKAGQGRPDPEKQRCIEQLDQAQYTVIPKSGGFRDLIQELDFIIGRLGCTIIQLLPIHPTPTTYARMGRFGSPYAALSFTAVDPGLAEFDPKATPLEQFTELVDAIHRRNARIFLDIAINHTGWAAQIHETHPHWLARDENGQIEVPGAWGVRWEDLTRLDYQHQGLWEYIAEVFLTWCQRGVDGFRCDAGYMIPLAAWQYITATVREQFPDTVFFLEGLGGKISVTRDLLNRGNLDAAYSELFQNYDRGAVESYLPLALDMGQSDGILIHFCETHDNNRLAARSETFARMRTALCALFSQNGGFAFANGVEWFATEKIDVHGAPSLNWGAEKNQVPEIGRLSRLLKRHPCFHDRAELRMVQQGEGNFAAMFRHQPAADKKLLAVANLDPDQPVVAGWPATLFADTELHDLLTGQRVFPAVKGQRMEQRLAPGEVLCLSPDSRDLAYVAGSKPLDFDIPERTVKQRLQAKALDVFFYYCQQAHGNLRDLGDFDPKAAADALYRDPLAFCRQQNQQSSEPRVIRWQWPMDARREVMVPPGHFLLVRSEFPFHARISERNKTVWAEKSLPAADGAFFALFSPLDPPETHRSRTLTIAVFAPEATEHATGPLLYLSPGENAGIRRAFNRAELLSENRLFLSTNQRGGMCRADLDWGRLNSRYDALLAANLHPDYPEDRQVLFSRCRAWVVFQGYSREVRLECLHRFSLDEDWRGFWRYQIPTGQGEDIWLTIGLEMISEQNAIRLRFFRHPHGSGNRRLADDQPVQLILRPDIEDRNFHHCTKAYSGPEAQWPQAVHPAEDGFVFAPHSQYGLSLRLVSGAFVPEPEWYYMVHRPKEQSRGLDPHSDLFSPGYFSAPLKGGEHVELWAGATSAQTELALPDWRPRSREERSRTWPLASGLARALDHYVVRREGLSTVIAGYPWFLDWGRDTLIAVRGLIADGRYETVAAILKQFARFEHQGTLPNMIRGDDAGNRDTSDAPLWFFVACAELAEAGKGAIFDADCGGRSLKTVLIEMGDSLVRGTPNGIRMDPGSGLLFSPSHFTWMDTNHPAGTPREGYPVEIQALWQFALKLLARLDRDRQWSALADQVARSLKARFYLKQGGYLADCLQARPGQPAESAVIDDALRPNQLFALTLGTIRERDMAESILTACQELLVPGAIRSLADRRVNHPLPIRKDGRLLNEPHHPYQGRYLGDEDSARKPAYHNGTAWTWVFPAYCEAWAALYGKSGKQTARAWLSSSIRLINSGCVGQMPEITDGDAPHRQRGCDAQAWGVSELLRVWLKLG